MKNIILAIFILVTTISFSQSERVSYVSCEKDTLLLPNNELGMRIFITWFEVNASERPVILLASEDLIDDMNRSKYTNYTNKKEDEIIISENVYEFVMD